MKNNKTNNNNKKSKGNKRNNKGKKAGIVSTITLILIGLVATGCYFILFEEKTKENNNTSLNDNEIKELKENKEKVKKELTNITFYKYLKDDQDIQKIIDGANKSIDSSKTIDELKVAKDDAIKELNNGIMTKLSSYTADELKIFCSKIITDLDAQKTDVDSDSYDKNSITMFNKEIDEKIAKIQENQNNIDGIKDTLETPLTTKPIPLVDSIEFHFPYVKSSKTGDCVFVKAGETDILIDAGSEKDSGRNIRKYLIDNKLVTDNKLEYVICTHAHTDHMSGFIGKSDKEFESEKNGIFYTFKVDNIIDFGYYGDSSHGYALNNFDSIKDFNKSTTLKKKLTETSMYGNYVKARTNAIKNGAKHTTVYDYFTQNKDKKSWDITVGKNLTMSIMYQYFYDHPNTTEAIDGLNKYNEPGEKHKNFSKSNFSDQNDFSVFTLFNQANKRYALFTGDGETYSEYSLSKEHNLPKVDLFKAGHHGSYTASTEFLLKQIQPKTCVACCVCGNQEYAKNPNHSFPSQEFINRIAKWTDRVYAPTQGSWNDKKFHTPLNGNIIIRYDRNFNETLICSNNDIKLKDTKWFKENRKCPKEWEK